MNEKPVYLKQNVISEPIVDHWYAWSHLVSPATLALNIKNRHLKIMNSYLQAPKIHQAAVKNPKMLGGPFVDYQTDRSEDVRALRDKTENERKIQLEFAEALETLNTMLLEEANGYSIEPLYAKVPEILKGFVELNYDLNNNPSYRLFESLLYHSKYYNESLQAFSLYLTEEDYRPPVLSTPRLRGDQRVYLELPFADKRIDELFQMKTEPQPLSSIMERLEVDTEEREVFKSFFTETAPPPLSSYTGSDTRVRYFGHACVLIESQGMSVLVDPVISYLGYENEISRFSFQDLPEKIDYLLITHNHQDHILLETLLQLRHRVENIIVPRSGDGLLHDPSLKLMFQKIGFANVRELAEMEELQDRHISITGIPFLGEHSDLSILSKLAYVVKTDTVSVMLAVDSCNLEPRMYDHIQRVIGNVDVLFVGLECEGAPLSWLYGPLMPTPLPRDQDRSRTLSASDYDGSIDIAKRFRPKEVYIYAMGQEPWLNYIMSKRYTDDSKPMVSVRKLLEDTKHQGMASEILFGKKELFY